MHAPSNISLAERIESLKAGSLAGLSAALFFAAAIASNFGFSLWLASSLSWHSTVSVNLPISWAIAALSGFLFGITYRYVIRQDQNPHLKSGAVLAFGLVRGLAQLDASLSVPEMVLPSAILVVESVLLFAFARLVLDWAFGQGWVKLFSSN